MQLTAPWNTTETHRNLVLELLNTCDSVGNNDIRQALGCTAGHVHLVMDDLITEGHVQADTRGPIRYSKRTFTFEERHVRPEWFERLKRWFQGGKSETSFLVARQLDLKWEEVEATMEAMRQQGWLHGRFVGRMCIYALVPRGTTLQGPAGQQEPRVIR
ncbi:hypothetical protein [Deinococcus roseus]|uniref:Uncharacterized protein n=1 Tax=Deinococcus roseus TaxID=392414 RepID=A0ABQ2DC40_9DEIO|nr:hypothetical protein [Deinococcus roseus]GGJ52422.1 hypothetical protein GCM10008938_43060 [Deinococcus roseus]